MKTKPKSKLIRLLEKEAEQQKDLIDRDSVPHPVNKKAIIVIDDYAIKKPPLSKTKEKFYSRLADKILNKNQKAKPVYGWIIKDEKNIFDLFTCARSKTMCISNYISVFTPDWGTCQKEGYRCVKVKIEEV